MTGRFAPLVPVAGASLFPLLLVAGGLLDTADLMLALAAETALLTLFAGLQSAFSSTSGIGSLRRFSADRRMQSQLDDLVGRALLLAALLCVGAAGYAATQVTWDWTSQVGVVLVLGYAFAGLWRSSWQSASVLPHGVRGVAWRLVLVIVGFGLCLPLAGAAADLEAAGWSSGLGGVGAVPAVPGLPQLLTSDLLPAEAWPALLLLLFRGVNELGFAAVRLAGAPEDTAR